MTEVLLHWQQMADLIRNQAGGTYHWSIKDEFFVWLEEVVGEAGPNEKPAWRVYSVPSGYDKNGKARNNGYRILFRDPRHAMLCKLTWGGR